MAGRNDFLIFNENKDNMLTQDLYQADSDRLDGFKKGIARSNVNNKVLHQTSMMCHAFGELLKEIGLNASDEMTVAELTKNLKDLLSSNGGGGLEIADIGIASLGIDETQNKRRYLNGQLLIQEQFVSFTNKVKKAKELYPNLFCTEEEWQATVTMSTFGQCGKFVIDDEAGTIRLPKITGFIQGLTDLASLGELVEAGLPSISHTHTRGTMNITGDVGCGSGSTVRMATGNVRTGAFAGSSVASVKNFNDASGTDTKLTNINFDASRSWTGATSTNSAVPALYGKSNTVQPEAIHYPYFIQVATGAEETVDVTREIELNNPFFFGYYQYFETAPNNISWLKSAGQWNDKIVYTDYYDWILTNANNGVANFKLSTDTYDDYAWVVNTADETFRLPIKTKNAPFTVNGTANVSVYGNGKTLGLTNGTDNGAICCGSDTILVGSKSGFNSNVGTAVGTRLSSSGCWGVTTDATKSGLTGKATVSTSENTNVSLYFYVGETTQNANLVNVGRIEEVIVDIKKDYLDLANDVATNTANIATKADTSFSNVNSTAKTNSTGWGIPNYSAGVTVSSGSYKPPKNGVLIGNRIKANNNAKLEIKYQSEVIFTNSTGDWPGHADKCYCPVISGHTYTITVTSDYYTLKFYPFRGV